MMPPPAPLETSLTSVLALTRGALFYDWFSSTALFFSLLNMSP
jgi:hypothetical protein